MGRNYHLSKKITDAESEEILKEIRQIEEVTKAEIKDDHRVLLVETENQLYPFVMSKVVNICRRVAGGCELSFYQFQYE